MIKIYKNIYVNASVLLILLCFMNSLDTLGLTLFSIIMHECGHLFMLKFLNAKIEKIVIHAFGIAIHSESLEPFKMATVAFSGPFMSLFLAVIFYFTEASLFVPNLMLGIINMFPIVPLDGGRGVYYFLLKICGRKSSRIVMRVLGFVFGIGFLLPGFILFLYSGYNVTLLMLGLFILVSGMSFPVSKPARFIRNKITLADVYIIPENIKYGFTQLPADSIGIIVDEKGKVVKMITASGMYYELAEK